MLRKIVCMVLVSVLMLNVCLAFAENPSPALSVVIQGEVINKPVTENDEYIVVTIQPLPEQKADDSEGTTTPETTVPEITEEAIIGLFDDNRMMEKVTEVSQEIKAEDNLAVLEVAVISVEVSSEEKTEQDVEVSFQFPTEYNEEAPTLVIIGLQDEDGNIEWVPVESVLIDGKLIVKIDKELLKNLVISDMSYIVVLQKTEE